MENHQLTTNQHQEDECIICGNNSANSYEIRTSLTDIQENTVPLCSTHYQTAAIFSEENRTELLDEDIPTGTDTQKITVRVPRALVDAADAFAEERGETRSEVVRDALVFRTTLNNADEGFDDILQLAIQAELPQNHTDIKKPERIAFLEERIRRLEYLLEKSIESD